MGVTLSPPSFNNSNGTLSYNFGHERIPENW